MKNPLYLLENIFPQTQNHHHGQARQYESCQFHCDRLKINKILVTIKHLKSQQVEEGEFDIEAIENELVEKRHYSSANRWVPIQDIKNGYITNTRHTMLISDAAALDYILF